MEAEFVQPFIDFFVFFRGPLHSPPTSAQSISRHITEDGGRAGGYTRKWYSCMTIVVQSKSGLLPKCADIGGSLCFFINWLFIATLELGYNRLVDYSNYP